MEILRHTLPNGIRLVHHPVAGDVAHCGLFIHAGSRDEREDEHGMAHFIEHTIFKGTEKRNVIQILNRLENVGSDLNAYTTKEETCIHASFLAEYYDRALELFQDIFFHSVFPADELEREKFVVTDEIRSYRDTPSEQIFDDFEDHLFAGHPLGRNILGTPASLRRITRMKVLDFIHRNYRLEEVVIASAGKIDFRRLVKLVTRYFGEDPGRGANLPRERFSDYKPFNLLTRKRTAQVHCMLGAPAYPFGDARRVPLALLNNMLGGPLMNSRLSLALREKNGLAYHSESNYTAYSDSGVFMIYFGTEPGSYDRALTIVHHELSRLRSELLSGSQLAIVKRQISGQLAIAQESNLSLMLAMGRSFLLQDSFTPIGELIDRINAITASELTRIASELLAEEHLSVLTYHP